ncbi:hypothetical protein [uncultured Thermosynechococcus sp.]|uniref:hypothetical protein n=1 Tax=uncultured Thermosynechococcus sp. TaxID=436945 RepID=UPI00344FEFA5
MLKIAWRTFALVGRVLWPGSVLSDRWPEIRNGILLMYLLQTQIKSPGSLAVFRPQDFRLRITPH